MKVPKKGIPRDLLDKAECVVIIPDLKSGALPVGGKYGRGFVSCRHRSERWGPPAGVRIEGSSYGFRIGGSSPDVFMLIMNENGMKRLLSDKFTIGGEAAAAAGPDRGVERVHQLPVEGRRHLKAIAPTRHVCDDRRSHSSGGA